MKQPDWEGFGIRLGRAIDRWPGGGQRAFAAELKRHAEKSGIAIPLSYRTLLNYLSGETHPSMAWIDAAAAVLRWNPEHLRTGQGPEQSADYTSPFRVDPRIEGDETDKIFVLGEVIDEGQTDLPTPAVDMIFACALLYFEGDDEEWGPDHYQTRRDEVGAWLDEFYRPLLSRPTIRYAETMALAASLTATAYLRIAAGIAKPLEQPEEENDGETA